jgi:hypothetical protein
MNASAKGERLILRSRAWFEARPHPEEPERSEGVSKDDTERLTSGVSKDQAHRSRTAWFETRGCAALLTMRLAGIA